MLISGLQKLSLVDYPNKLAATVFTGGCNFRCPFCHNASLVLNVEKDSVIDEDDFFSFLVTRKNKLDGVCVSGGEPLLQPDLEDFLKKIKEMGFLVKLDTNGSLPEKLINLVGTGLIDYVAMDIKNSPMNYLKTIGLKSFDLANIMESVEFLKQGTVPYEFRTTIVKELHDEEDIKAIGEWLKGAENYYLQSFVDSGDLIVEGLTAHEPLKMLDFQKILKNFVKNVSIRGI